MRSKEVKHITGDGTEQTFTRLYADEGKALTLDGETVWNCVDVPPNEVDQWQEIDAPEEPEKDYSGLLEE